MENTVVTCFDVKSNLKEIQGISFLLEEKFVSKSQYRYERTLGRRIETDHNVYTQSEYVKSISNMCAYKFERTNRCCRPEVNHQQLRHGVCAINDHCVLYVNSLKVFKFDRVINASFEDKKGYLGDKSCILDFKDRRSMISGMDVLHYPNGDSILGTGTLRGELHLLNLRNGDVLFHEILDKSSPDDNYVNGVQIVKPSNSTKTYVLVSANDNKTRIYILEGSKSFETKLFHTLEYSEAINFGKLSPVDENLLVFVGDFNEVMLYDLRTQKIEGKMEGHEDFCFSISFNPNCPLYQLAISSQDHSCGIWDLRMKKMKYRLMTVVDHCRTVQYSDDGNFLASIEGTDFIHLYDVKKNYKREQLIDVFGTLSGISFSPGSGSNFFAGIDERTYGSIMEFKKVRFDKENDISNILQ